MTWKDIEWPDVPFDLEVSMVLAGRRGSEAHGTYIPPTEPDAVDDRDIMAICVPPANYYLGLSKWEGAEAMKGQWDVVLYEYRKFVRLLMKQNPNVIGMLWLEPEDYLFRTPAGDLLIEKRHLFRHRSAAFNAFTGYAYSQLKKMKGGEYRGYMGARRKALIEKHGFDTKNASHLVRLLHTGEEYLRTGEMQVRRTWDRDMLIAIKRGEWPLERVQRYAETYFAKCDTALAQSSLPAELDVDAVEKIVLATLCYMRAGTTR